MKFIVEGKEETSISEEAKEWFWNSIKNKHGVFECKIINGEECIVLTVKLTEQEELF